MADVSCLKCGRWLQIWSTAKLLTQSAACSACELCRIHQYGCHSLRVTQTSMYWHAAREWLHKNKIFAYITCLIRSGPAQHKCVIIHDDGLIGCFKSAEHAITAPFSEICMYVCICMYVYTYVCVCVCVVFQNPLLNVPERSWPCLWDTVTPAVCQLYRINLTYILYNDVWNQLR